jgi:polyphosphate kinase
VPLEEVIRDNLDTLYPNSVVYQAYFFRVTRAGDLQVDEQHADDLLEAVDAATRRRPENAVVRVEVERAMPAVLRDLVLDELRREPGADALSLGIDDVYEVDGPLDLRCVDDLALPKDAALHFPPFTPAEPVRPEVPVVDAVRPRDLLVHHPFESFAGTVVRFLQEAAVDPDVTTIKLTLYRAGDRSPVVEALSEAARRGKQTVAFVELRARFDEERNVAWVRALETAGVHVVYGLVGYKTHAKAALVVRREQDQLRRYAHVGTGNYNPRTGLHYTDLSLLTADEAITADVADLFNALTGSSAPPERLARGALVAPGQLLHALLEQIEREAAHARAGREARIRIKVNGLSDAEVVRALQRAAQDGVRVELAVRGICTLRPLAPTIRVVAHVGRFLEHSRIYHFANGGDPRYYIGSADLRTRNLRRRVELLVPVRDAAARATLDRLLGLYLDDPTAWELTASGTYVRRTGGGLSAQEALMREVGG